MNNKRIIKEAGAFTLAYLGAWIMFLWFNIQISRENMLIYIVLMFGIYFCVHNMSSTENPKVYLLSTIYSILLGASFVFGRSLYNDWGIEKKDFLLWIGVSGLFLCIIPHVMRFVLDVSDKYVLGETTKFGFKRWLIRGAVILLVWIPVFLTFYPGNGSSDSCSSVMQALGEQQLNNHHPVMFTVFVKVCLQLGMIFGSLEEGIVVFSLAQMIIMAFAFSACVEWMKSRGFSRAWQWTVTLFWTLNPIVMVYSLTMWKDILFSVWILLFVIYLYDAVMKGPDYIASRKSLILLGILSVLTAFGRNNGIYIVCVILAVIVILCKKYWKRILIFSLLLIFSILLVQGPVYKMMGINSGSFAESVGIPLQQIGHTVANDGSITKEQKEFIDQLLPTETIKEVYNPYTVDAIKFNSNFNSSYLEEHKFEFLLTWAQLLPANLKGYIEAYAMQTLGYWYMDIANWKCTFTLEYAEQYGLIQKNIVQQFTGIDTNSIVQKVIAKNDILPVIGYLFKVALPLWVGGFACMIMIIQKRKKYILSLLPLFITWGTLMIAAPVYCEFRYMFSLHLCLPVLLAFMCQNPATRHETVERKTDLKLNYRKIARIVASFALGVISCNYTFVIIESSCTIFLLVLTAIFYKMLKNIRLDDKLKVCCIAGFSLLWSIAVSVSRKIDKYSWGFATNFGWLDVLHIACIFVLTFVIMCNIFEFVFLFSTEKKDQQSFDKKGWGIKSSIIFICWLPYFLLYFPGNLTSDSYSSISQAIGAEMLSNHHPVMFTVLVKACLMLGEPIGGLEAGVAVFSLVQMTIFALTLGFCLEWLRVRGMRKWLRYSSFLFFAFSPLIALYSFTMWKDILFSCWIMWLGIILFDMIDSKKDLGKKQMLLLGILSFLISFSRNNGIYIIIVLFVILLIMYKKIWKKLVLYFAAVLLIVVFIQGPGYDILNIRKGNIAETFGIPLQQISYTVKYNGDITEEQHKFLNCILPESDMKEAYNPISVNDIKFHENFDNEFLEENKVEFLKTWTEILVKNPVKYIKAYCMQTMGYWHVDTIGYTYSYGADDNWLGISDRNILEELTGKNGRLFVQNNLPIICGSIPGINLLFCTAFSFWLMIVCVTILIIKRKLKYIVALVPYLALWGTLMIAAPASGEFRYIFALNIAIPFFIMMIFYGKNKKEKGYK